MTNEVVHDDPYTEYLAELAELDKIWRIPGVSFNVGGLVLIPWATMFFVLAPFFTPTWWWVIIPLTVVEVIGIVVYALYLRRLSKRYRAVSWGYLPEVIPLREIHSVGFSKLSLEGRTVVRGECEYDTFWCDLRKFAESRGEKGWTITTYGPGTLPMRRLLQAMLSEEDS